MSERAFVTGGNGFVGRHLCAELTRRGHDVLAIGISRENEAKCPFPYVPVDITDPEAVTRKVLEFRPTWIFHLAGIAFVPEAESNFERALRINVVGVQTICAACHTLELGSKIVLASSGEVYGRILPEDLPLREDCPTKPANNYSLSKLMAELILPRYQQFGHIQGVALRLFNHIGPGQDSRFVASSFARQIAQIKLKKAPPVMSVGNLSAKRDFSDVRDVVLAYILAAERGEGIINIGSGRAVAVQEILDTLLRIADVHVQVELDPARLRASEVPEVRACIDRAKEKLGWEPIISLEQSLRDIYEYWLKEEQSNV